MRVRRLRLIHSPSPQWERLRDFYTGTLGLEPSGGWDLPGDRGAFLAAGTAELELMEQDVNTLGVLPGARPGWHLALEVDDAEAEHQRLRALGVPIVRELQTQPWGSRDFVIRDPAGNAVLLFSGP